MIGGLSGEAVSLETGWAMALVLTGVACTVATRTSTAATKAHSRRTDTVTISAGSAASSSASAAASPRRCAAKNRAA